MGRGDDSVPSAGDAALGDEDGARVGGGDARIAIGGVAMDVAGELVEDEDERDGGSGEASDHASSTPDSAAASVGAKRADTASSAARCAEPSLSPAGNHLRL